MMLYGASMVKDQTKDAPGDIRPALWQRLRDIEAELDRMPERQRMLEELRDSLKALIANEDALRDEGEVDESTVPAFHPTKDNRTLADFIIQVLRTGPKTLDRLKFLGASVRHLQDSNSPGRAINFALVGLQKGGHVERLADGRWKLVSAKAEDETETPR
jgi:hypothetical protein